MPFFLTIMAGEGTTVTLDGIFLTIVVFAPILTLSPILIGPKTTAPVPTITLFPITGIPFL